MAITFLVDAERAQRVIAAVRKKHNYYPPTAPETIEARPAIPFVPMTPERKAELLEALERRLPRTQDEEPVS